MVTTYNPIERYTAYICYGIPTENFYISFRRYGAYEKESAS